MKAGIIFTGSGALMILTSYKSFTESKLVEKLNGKGIKKFICYEVPIEKVKDVYKNHFNVVLGDLRQEDDLRVVDYDGHHVFYSFKIKELGEPFCHE